MSTTIDVLDHGYVRLVSYIQPVPINGLGPEGYGADNLSWTGDLEIVRNARTSYNADWRGDDPEGRGEADRSKDEKLIHYLWSHRHTTPFEAMVFTFEVQAPIFVFRQWHRHRTWSYNEVSARYTELPELFYIPEPGHIGEQSKTNKQGREIPDDLQAKHFAEIVVPAMIQASENAHVAYHVLLQSGVARELARLVLPLNTYSRMFATVDLRNLFHFLELRLDSHAQYEIRVYAQALLDLVEPICPVAVEAFKKELAP